MHTVWLWLKMGLYTPGEQDIRVNWGMKRAGVTRIRLMNHSLVC